MQSGIKTHGNKGKASVMKEAHDLVTKNDSFGELNYDELADEMKIQALLLLILMTAKRNGDVKSRRVVNVSFQKTCASK